MINEFNLDATIDDGVTYELNPNYRGITNGEPFFQRVVLRASGDSASAASEVLETNSADYASNLRLEPAALRGYDGAVHGRIDTAFTTNVERLLLNQTDPGGVAPSVFDNGNNAHRVFFQNDALVRALSLAIDRQALVAEVWGPSTQPTCNIWPVGQQASSNTTWCMTQDVAEANRILDSDLGYLDTDSDGVRETPDGQPLVFDFVSTTTPERIATQERIKQYWQAIGVAVNLESQPSRERFDSSSAASLWKFPTDIQVYRDGDIIPHALDAFAQWRTTAIPTPSNNWQGQNIARMSNGEFDELWDQLSSMTYDDPQRTELIIRMNDIIVAESGSTIPLIQQGIPSAIGIDLTGVGAPNGWDSEYWNLHEWARSN